MSIIHGNKENINELISGELVLVDFFATWCGPCRMLGPVLEDIANERSRVKIVKIDIDENAELARAYGIMSVPTMILFKNGVQVDTRTGFMPKDEVMKWIES